MAIEVVDTQIHRPLPRAPWPEFDSYVGYPRGGGDVLDTGPSGAIQLAVGVELAMAGMEAAGVDAAIVYSGPEFCQAAVAGHPASLASVYDYYDPGELGDPDTFVAGLRAQPGVLGVRLLPGIDYAEQRNLALLTEGGWDPILAAAARHGLPFVFFVPLCLRHMHRVAREFPELRIVIDHCGMPAPPTAPERVRDRLLDTLPELLELAQYENVAVKLTGLPVLAPGSYPFPAVWPVLHRLLDAFGAERLMWGSDVHRVTGRVWEPPLRVEGHERITYAELVGYLLHSDEVGEPEKVAMLGAGARRWFDWPAQERSE